MFQLAESRQKSNLPSAVTSLCITFLIMQHQYETSHAVPLFSPCQIILFACNRIFLKLNSFINCWASLKTGRNLRNSPSHYTREAVTQLFLLSTCVEGGVSFDVKRVGLYRFNTTRNFNKKKACKKMRLKWPKS